MVRRRILAAATALLAALAAGGCASTENGAGDAACAAPTLTWVDDSVRPGGTAAARGENLMAGGCHDGGQAPGEPSPTPMTIDQGQLLDGDGAVVSAPTVDGVVAADPGGELELQVAVPPDVAAGTVLVLQIIDTGGRTVRSGELAVVG